MQRRFLFVASILSLALVGCGADAGGFADGGSPSPDASPRDDARASLDGDAPDSGAPDLCAPGMPGVYDLDAPDAPFVAIAGREAPATVHLHALTDALGVPSRDILASHYEWTFGEPSGRHDRLVGWSAAHVYDRPGDYCATLRVTDPDGTVTVVRARVPVAASTRRPIHVSPDGDDTADGRSPENAVRSVGRAAELLAEDGSDRDVLFERGRTHVVPEGEVLAGEREEPAFGRVNGTNVRFAAYGPGTERPLLLWDANANRTFVDVQGDARSDSGARDVTVEGLAFDQVDAPIDRTRRPVIVLAAGINITARDNEVRNVLTFVNGQAGDQGDGPREAPRALRGLLVQDNLATTSTSVLMYFVWMQGEDFAALGNSASNSVEEHIFRGSPIRAIFAYNTVSNEDRRFVDSTTGELCRQCDGEAGCNRLSAPSGCECNHPDGCDELDYAKGVFVLRGDYNYAFANEVPTGPSGVEPLCPYEETARRVSIYGAFDSNRVHDGPIFVHAMHAVVRNNYVECEGDGCLRITAPAMCRDNVIGDIRFHHNTARQRGQNGGRIFWLSDADDVEIVNNLGILDAGRDCIAWGTHALTMNGAPFAFRGNVWKLDRPESQQCFRHAGTDMTHADWASRDGVEQDVLVDVTLDVRGYPTTDLPRFAQPPGSIFDRLGSPRQTAATPGAHEQAPF